MNRTRDTTTIHDRLERRLRRGGRGKVFTPKDFLDIGSREAVDQTLSRLVKAGTIQRIGRGLYFYPRMNRRLGLVIPPDVDAVADAVARQTGSRIVPSGATAANRLGLSPQVPGRFVYLTDGRSRTVRVGKTVLTFRHVTPKELPAGHRDSATVVQALHHLGRDAVDAAVVTRLRQALPEASLGRLRHDARYTTDWIADVVRRVVDDTDKEPARG